MKKSEAQLEIDSIVTLMDEKYITSRTLEETIEALRVRVKYMLLDLEATRKERDAYKGMI